MLSVSSVFARPKVALVLSGGAARGLAEIPLLKALEDEGIPIDMVLGTSFGSIVGALYSAGYTPKDIEEILSSQDYIKLLNEKSVSKEMLPPRSFQATPDNYFSFAFSQNGLGATAGILGDQNIVLMLSDYFSRILHITDFDQLPVPFRAITTEASTGNLKVLDSGSLVQAVRASMALPLIWQPAPLDGNDYAFDGGLRNNLPISVAKELGADFIIAMDVMGNMPSDPRTLKDMASVVVQVFDIVISNTVHEQYKIADLTLIPDLSDYAMMDFIHVQGIIDAGQKCVDQNKDKIHELALKMEKAGIELQHKDYDRPNYISQLPDPIIEKIEIRDISLMEECPLPNPDSFKSIIGHPLDSKAKAYLHKKIKYLRDDYHLSSLTYYPKQGSTPGSCILELQANHYSSDLSNLFVGGENMIMAGAKSDTGRFGMYPVFNLNTGFAIRGPVDLVGKITVAPTSTIEFSVLPVIAYLENSLRLKFEGGAKFLTGSLEPESYYYYSERVVSDDNGFYTNAGLEFSYIDAGNIRLGVAYESDYLNSKKEHYNRAEVYSDLVINTLGNPLTEMQGINFQLQGNYAYSLPDFIPYIRGRVSLIQRFEVIPDRIGLGYDIELSINRYPYNLNSGYFEYGGIHGMPGFTAGTFKRDIASVGLTYQQRLWEIGGIPFGFVLQGKAGISDNFTPFPKAYNTEKNIPVPGNDLFSGCNFIDAGVSGYLTLKIPFGSLFMGLTWNNRNLWNFVIGLN